MLKARLLDGTTYEKLAEMFDLSVRQTKNIIRKTREQVFRHTDKLAHIKKSLLTAEAMWEDSDYSQEGGQSRRGSYRNSNRGSYRRSRASGNSYEDGRRSSARRDSMGRYSTAEAEEIAEELRDLMQDAPDQQTKQDIQKIVRRLEQM